MVFIFKSSFNDYVDVKEWLLYWVRRMDFKIIRVWDLTYHQWSVINLRNSGSFSLTISSLTAITSLKSLEIIFPPLTLVFGEVEFIAKKP